MVPVFIEAPYHEGIWGGKGLVPCTLGFATTWNSVASFTSRLLYYCW